MHGGANTGPRTAEGLERSRRARWKHGQHSAAALAEQKRVRELLTQSRKLLKQMQAQNDRRCHGVWGSSAAFVPWRSSDQRRQAVAAAQRILVFSERFGLYRQSAASLARV
jgi:hypothetical protein